MKNINITFLITLISFFVYAIFENLYFDRFYSTLKQNTNQLILSYILASLLVGMPVFLAVFQLKNKMSFFYKLVRKNDVLTGFLYGILMTLPMFFAYIGYFSLNKIHFYDFFTLLIGIFFYEFYFKYFFFRLIYENTKLGLMSILLLNFLVFFIIRIFLYQWDTFPKNDELLFLLCLDISNFFVYPFLQMVFFSWLYVEWKFNLWLIVFFHFFMDLYWKIFITTEAVFDNIYKITFLLISCILMIYITFRYKKKTNTPFKITKKTIWMK